jgi:hypothetical protein
LGNANHLEVPVFGGSKIEIEVSLRLVDGSIARGTLNPGLVASLDSVLNKESPFLEFTSKEGQKRYIAKAQILSVEPVEPLKKPKLAATKDGRFTDGYELLGIQQGCSLDEARTAFHAKVKLYHPDKFSGIELPPEVASYMSEMFRQVNTAFTELRSELSASQASSAAA